ncbi:Imm26 family immunity protein [Mariniflexile maritimum]|uniref:Imm26 family immunity protein n=1 Tax=Mariniflexile maritimum TaxID=2682493 RepID=UPI0012F63695|nr:Imm26 family immunity protein [Mariniflexile maritimum]
MKTEFSGNIYRISLDFDLGFVYAELLDYTDVREFDGILIQVYNYIETGNEKQIDIEKIKSNEILFGPVPINKYPNNKGKFAWKYIGKSNSYSKEFPWFKSFRGLINKDDNWSNLSPWFKANIHGIDSNSIEYNYEDVRRLETLILNHPEMVKIKVTMLLLINKGEIVRDFYDLTNIGNRNMYIQLINTYYDNNKVEELLKYINIRL